MIIDFAERAHNHNWDLDPVVRSLLDTDFYKLLMLQFIWKHFPTTQVSFSVSNRSSSAAPRGCDCARRGIATAGARAQPALSEIGTDLAGRQHLLRPSRYLRTGLYRVAGTWLPPIQLPAYGQGWRIPPGIRRALDRNDDVGDLRALHHQRAEDRAPLQGLSEFELDILYAQAKTRLWGKIERLTRGT